MRSFVITVDTESDNQWDVTNRQTTENAKFIPRFQKLCEKYGFKPTYLVDYSMANDEFLVEYLNDRNTSENSEVGMHLHAWDTPPYYKLRGKYSGRPYLIEYPEQIIKEKIAALDSLLKEKFDRCIVSHRAGRWALNEFYAKSLYELGYRVDCSVTPSIDWSKQKGETRGGSNYRLEPKEIYSYKETGLLEIPMTVCRMHGTFVNRNKGMVRTAKDIVKSVCGNIVWFRPAIFGNYDLKKLIDLNVRNNGEYLEMMIHSSELMPGGSPYFADEKAVDELFERLEELFAYLRENRFEGKTLYELYEMKRGLLYDI